MYTDFTLAKKYIGIRWEELTLPIDSLRRINNNHLPSNLESLLSRTGIIYKKKNYLEINDYINANQGGFRKGKSTVITATDLTDDIGMGLNNNEYTIANFIDLRKAFDTVNHEVLIN